MLISRPANTIIYEHCSHVLLRNQKSGRESLLAVNSINMGLSLRGTSCALSQTKDNLELAS